MKSKGGGEKKKHSLRVTNCIFKSSSIGSSTKDLFCCSVRLLYDSLGNGSVYFPLDLIIKVP